MASSARSAKALPHVCRSFATLGTESFRPWAGDLKKKGEMQRRKQPTVTTNDYATVPCHPDYAAVLQGAAGLVVEQGVQHRAVANAAAKPTRRHSREKPRHQDWRRLEIGRDSKVAATVRAATTEKSPDHRVQRRQHTQRPETGRHRGPAPA